MRIRVRANLPIFFFITVLLIDISSFIHSCDGPVAYVTRFD